MVLNRSSHPDARSALPQFKMRGTDRLTQSEARNQRVSVSPPRTVERNLAIWRQSIKLRAEFDIDIRE